MRCFVIGILMIRLSQSGSIVNGAPLLRPFQCVGEFSSGGGFHEARPFAATGSSLPWDRSPKFPWVATVEGGRGIV